MDHGHQGGAHRHQTGLEKALFLLGGRLDHMGAAVAGNKDSALHYLRHVPHGLGLLVAYHTWQDKAILSTLMFEAVCRGQGQAYGQDLRKLVDSITVNMNDALRRFGRETDFTRINGLSINLAGLTKESAKKALQELGRRILENEGMPVDMAVVDDVISTYFSGVIKQLEAGTLASEHRTDDKTDETKERKHMLIHDLAEQLQRKYWLEPDFAEAMAEKLVSVIAAVNRHISDANWHRDMAELVRNVKLLKDSRARAEAFRSINYFARVHKMRSAKALLSGADESGLEGGLRDHVDLGELQKMLKNLRSLAELGGDLGNIHASLYNEQHYMDAQLFHLFKGHHEREVISINGELHDAVHKIVKPDSDTSDAGVDALCAELSDVSQKMAHRFERVQLDLRSEWDATWQNIESHAGRGYVALPDEEERTGLMSIASERANAFDQRFMTDHRSGEHFKSLAIRAYQIMPPWNGVVRKGTGEGVPVSEALQEQFRGQPTGPSTREAEQSQDQPGENFLGPEFGSNGML